MVDEHQTVRRLFDDLMKAPTCRFPARGGSLDAPSLRGVYVIYGPGGRVLHVGGTPFAKNGLVQRLRAHLAGKSSFVVRYLHREPTRLRRGYKFQCLVVENARVRALLEAHAIGRLCPAHIGHGLDGRDDRRKAPEGRVDD